MIEYLTEHRNMLEGVCVTGGEPTLHKDLESFLHKIKQLGLKVKLDSNGINPQTLESFFADGLVDYVAMDIKAPWGRYGKVIQVSETIGSAKCKKSLEVIQNSGVDHEFRTTVLPGVHTDDDFTEMAGYLRPGERYYVQDIRYNITLDPTLDSSLKIDVPKTVKRLQARYPKLVVQAR